MNDTIHLLVENSLLRLLAALPADTPAMSVAVHLNGLAAVVRIGLPADLSLAANSGRLTPRQTAALEAARTLVDRHGRRVLGSEIQAELKATGAACCGKSTVNGALADLVANGWLVNDNDKRGYGLGVTAD
jgi:hypothetical protein